MMRSFPLTLGSPCYTQTEMGATAEGQSAERVLASSSREESWGATRPGRRSGASHRESVRVLHLLSVSGVR